MWSRFRLEPPKNLLLSMPRAPHASQLDAAARLANFKSGMSNAVKPS